MAAHGRGLHVVAAAGSKVVSKKDNQGIVQFQPFKEVGALTGRGLGELSCCLLLLRLNQHPSADLSPRLVVPRSADQLVGQLKLLSVEASVAESIFR